MKCQFPFVESRGLFSAQTVNLYCIERTKLLMFNDVTVAPSFNTNISTHHTNTNPVHISCQIVGKCCINQTFFLTKCWHDNSAGLTFFKGNYFLWSSSWTMQTMNSWLKYPGLNNRHVQKYPLLRIMCVLESTAQFLTSRRFHRHPYQYGLCPSSVIADICQRWQMTV